MNKILCPTDFSDTANRAADFAAYIASHIGAHLTLLHVIHLPIVDTSETALVASELLGEQMRDATERIKILTHRISEKFKANRGGDFTCDYIIKEALLTDITEHLTHNEGYDLLVMGTTGGGNALAELLIGSNTEAVVENVKCPLLAIPAKFDLRRIEKIVYASDYEPEDKLALGFIADLARKFEATIDIIHVVKESNPESRDKAAQFCEQLEYTSSGVPIRFQEVVSRHRDDGLKEYFRQENGSILAILRKEKGFLRELFSQSLAEKLTYQAEVPLLVLQGRMGLA
jgi:nucleotide-binding universal stress UspA family protein